MQNVQQRQQPQWRCSCFLCNTTSRRAPLQVATNLCNSPEYLQVSASHIHRPAHHSTCQANDDSRRKWGCRTVLGKHRLAEAACLLCNSLRCRATCRKHTAVLYQAFGDMYNQRPAEHVLWCCIKHLVMYMRGTRK